MVLADTSVWVDHLRRGVPRLAELLRGAEVSCHPFVIGELACGNLANRAEILSLLSALPAVRTANDDHVLRFIEANRLHGKGLGLIDVHLLASCALTRTPLWTRDERLSKAAAALGVGARD